jgi:DNA-binding transcriptional MerR regulator
VTYDGGMSARLSIGLVARRTGATVPTVRYYEEIGLLPAASRTASGQRSYDEATVRRLVFIRRCRDFGFSIDQVRELVGLVDEPDRPCVEVRDIAASHLQQVRRKLDELRELEASLSAIVCSCDSACAGGAAVDCTILEDLAVPGEDPARAPGTGCCPPRAVETPLFNETQGHDVRPSG